MKYKIMGISLCILVFVFTFFLSVFYGESSRPLRYHQHLSARQPDEGCDCSKEELCTHLPLVLIETQEPVPGMPLGEEGEGIGVTTTADGEKMAQANIFVIDNQDRNNHPGDSPALSSTGLIRIRGNSSRYFDKKGYLLRFTKEDGSYQHVSVMGMQPHYEWALHGPYLDKTLIRNYMWYNIGGEIMEWAPGVRFCEVLLNGQYIGLYVMTETITSAPGSRLNLTEPIEGTEETGYIVRIDRGSSTPVKNIETFTNYSYRNLQAKNIVYPRSNDLTPELADAIARDFSDFEKALYSYDYDTDDFGYWHHIDTDSFVDYLILNEFTANYDAGWLSTYIYKDVDGKFKLAIWDFNSACNLYKEEIRTPRDLEFQHNIWYLMLMKDAHFNKKVLNRYADLRESYLSEAYLNRYIDDTVAYLGDAIERNFQVWGYTFEEDILEPAERNPENHQQAIDQLKDFIQHRGHWLDENFDVILEFSHESKNKKYNH